MCLDWICLFAKFMLAAPVITAAVAWRRFGKTTREPYLFFWLAVLASVPSDISNLFRPIEYQWVTTHFYPGIQLGLFAAAIGGAPAALLTAFVTYALTSLQIAAVGLLEPNTIGIVAGSFVVTGLAWKWNHRLRPAVLVYCYGGAIAWLLWMSVRTEYSVLNTAAYLGYHAGTRLAGMALFVWAVYRSPSPPRG